MSVTLDLMEYANDAAAQAVYVSSDTTADTNTILLTHFGGADGSTTFTDETGKTITANGNAQIDTAQSKLGGSSGLFDGTGDYLSTPDSADWAFGTGDFTIDFWVRFSSTSGVQVIIGQYIDAANFWDINYESPSIQIRFYPGPTANYYASWAPSINTWYHIAWERTTTTAKLFIDGVSQSLSEGTAFSTNDVTDLAAPLYIGSRATSAYFNGWLDELRISKGIARWTANFTPPVRAYGGNLQCYSESTVKQQGSYSLNAYAEITNSLNDTLTCTVSPTIDLTGLTSWKFYIYSASRTGSNIKVGIRNAAFDTADLIPTMTSNTEPSGVASASSENDGTLQRYAYKAFNDAGTAEVGWQVNTGLPSGWLQYQFPTAKIITKYTLTGQNNADNVQQMPKDWTFKASATGAFTGEEVTLDTQTAITFTAGETKTYSFSNNTAYLYYRIVVTATGNGGTLLITEMEMMRVTTAVTTETTPNITSTGAWQLVDVDISGVSNANKDAIDRIIITLTNADADNTFYIDNMYAEFINKSKFFFLFD
jgi:hypothetical protein